MMITENHIRRALEYFYGIAVSTGKDIRIDDSGVGPVVLLYEDVIRMRNGDCIREFAGIFGCRSYSYSGYLFTMD